MKKIPLTSFGKITKGILPKSKVAPIWKRICEDQMTPQFQHKMIQFYKTMDEDDEEELMSIESSTTSSRRQQGPQWRYRRAGWEYGMAMLRSAHQLKSRCRMSEQAFGKLASLLRGQLAADVRQPRRSARGNGPITAEMAVGAGFRMNGRSLMAICSSSVRLPQAMNAPVDRAM